MTMMMQVADLLRDAMYAHELLPSQKKQRIVLEIVAFEETQ